MSLRDVQVYEDWQDRLRQARLEDRRAVLAVLLVVLFSVGLLAWHRWRVLQGAHMPLETAGLLGALYLIVGIAFLRGTALVRGRAFVVGSSLLAGAFLLGALVDVPETVGVGPFLLFPPLLLAGAQVMAAWSLVVWGMWARRRLPLSRAGALRTAVWAVIGAGAGAGVVLVWYLSARFGTLVPALGERQWAPDVEFWRALLVMAGVRAVAEEVAFRGALFHVLYHRRHMGFWRATAVTWAANNAVYAVQGAWLPAPPDERLLLLLGPTLLVLVNCGLYAVEGNVTAAVSSNVLFRALSVVLEFPGRLS